MDVATTSISIIGAGVVGSATGMGLHKMGHDVIFYDISKQKLLSLKEQGYQVGSSIENVISKTDISFVCVNTPTKNDGQQDLSQVTSVLPDIAKALNNIERRHHLVVFRSTMLPGTMRHIIIEYLDRNCNNDKMRGRDYDICYNPEFLRQNSALEDFFKPDRIVIGEDREDASLPLKQLYKDFRSDIIITNFEAAEMIKYTSNCFLSLKISFFNEISMICKEMGIDYKAVNQAVSLDKRIGKYGTEAGRPFGGACLPKDTQALAYLVKRLQIKPDLLQIILDINKKVEDEISTKLFVSEVGQGHG